MKTRKLGLSDIEVAPLAFGGNVFGWTVNETESFPLLDKFVEHGFNLIDTADVYSAWAPGNHGGESELIIGKWLKRSGKRDKVIIATKVGMEMGAGKKGLSKRYIISAVEDSLKRLQIDYIDLYQSHRDDPQTPIEETLSAYDELIKAGKVRYVGASNFSVSRLQESLDIAKAHSLPCYITLQPQYNLYDREDYEANYAEFCVKNNIGVISYYSLASGFLTGKYRSEADLSKSGRGAGVKSYLTPKGMEILSKIDILAKEYNSTPAQISLAWLMSRPAITAPIASATKISQLEDIMKAVNLQLNQASLDLLNNNKYNVFS
ncbi:MAG: aldo/keto reductase [Bacteriovoracaceae bacterium]|nr:aldo/keto reductase [Bacteriovoracaceae bacterium]